MTKISSASPSRRPAALATLVTATLIALTAAPAPADDKADQPAGRLSGTAGAPDEGAAASKRQAAAPPAVETEARHELRDMAEAASRDEDGRFAFEQGLANAPLDAIEDERRRREARIVALLEDASRPGEPARSTEAKNRGDDSNEAGADLRAQGAKSKSETVYRGMTGAETADYFALESNELAAIVGGVASMSAPETEEPVVGPDTPAEREAGQRKALAKDSEVGETERDVVGDVAAPTSDFAHGAYHRRNRQVDPEAARARARAFLAHYGSLEGLVFQPEGSLASLFSGDPGRE